MLPDDRVLIVYVPQPADFELIQNERWYRIPWDSAPAGIHAEYYGFYFGRRFGAQKWAIHYYAPRLGYELLFRRDLLPGQLHHPRAGKKYFKIQLGPIVKMDRPIPSLKWRRITFIETTGDRFLTAREVNDLLFNGKSLTNRKKVLREGAQIGDNDQCID